MARSITGNVYNKGLWNRTSSDINAVKMVAAKIFFVRPAQLVDENGEEEREPEVKKPDRGPVGEPPPEVRLEDRCPFNEEPEENTQKKIPGPFFL